MEPLETGSMKSLPGIRDLTKNLLRDGFKERTPDRDSIESKIKSASRSFMPDENRHTLDRLEKEK